MSIYIKKSIYDILSKSLNMSEKGNKAKFEKLKAAVIAILEKKEKADDKEEVKKAALYFAKDEYRYSYLEKSVNGEWIEKAGYGVGTVRIWKGKKYKKVATNPVKWVRVFDKHTRGAASSMGRYIAQVKRCNSVDELYQFCMKQRSLFQDENGVDLPIMDKLRAAIDEQSGKLEGSGNIKDASKADKRKDLHDVTIDDYSFQKVGGKWLVRDENDGLIGGAKFNTKNEAVEWAKRNILKREFNNDRFEQKQSAKETDSEKENLTKTEKFKNDLVNEIMSERNPYIYDQTPFNKKEFFERLKKQKTLYTQSGEDFSKDGILDMVDLAYSLVALDYDFVKDEKDRNRYIRNGVKSRVLPLVASEKNLEILKNYVRNNKYDADLEARLRKQNLYDIFKDVYEGSSDSESKKKTFELEKEDFQNAEPMSEKFKLLGLKKGQKVEYDGETYTVDAIAGTNHDKGKFQMSILQWDAQGNISKRKNITALNFDKVKPIENKESENKTYWIQDTRGNRLTNEDAKERIKDNLFKIDELNSKDEVPRKEMRIRDMENENQYLNSLLNSADRKELESEFEKHQNRSNAMKGNQNAYKGKPIEKAVEKYANDKKLKSTVDKISSADFVSTDLRKYFMNGIYHEDGYDIATDGRILSMMKSDYSKDDEGEITVTDKLLKIAEKELKKLNKELLLAEAKLKEAKKEAKQKGRGSNYYLEFENNVRKIKEEIDTIEKEKETGHIAGQFPAYKRVIPSLGNSKLDNIKGFEDFDNILRVAKVAAAYIKEKDDNNTVVKVGDKYFKPELLVKVVAMAKKHGLNNVLYDPKREYGPVEFKGENGSVVIMPINPDESNVFDSETGEVSSQKNYDKQQIEDFMNGNAELNTKDEERNAKREEKLSRTASEETKQSLSEDVPEGITPANYKAYIDFGAKQYTKWGYDMNDPRNQKQLKEQIKEIAQQIENKDFSIIDSLENKDNVFTRMIWTYQTGGIAPGNTREETKKNVERYFGPEATKKHKEELESKRIQVEKERAENEKRILTNKVKSIFDKSHVNYGQLSSEDAREKLTEYLSTLPSNRQESAIKRLSKDLIRYQKDGKDKVSYTLDYIIDSIKDGRTLDDIKRTYRDIRSKPLVSFAEWYINNKLGIQKSVLLDDYAEFIDINLDEDYETDNEEFDDYEDYDASQPELFNSISYKVGNVLDDLYCC